MIYSMPSQQSDEVRKRFGKRLRELRLTAGLSQEQLAEAAELDRTYISSTERGRRNISLEAISRIASALNISPAEFFPSSGVNLKKKKERAV
jgi:transcriptional regulator with XRE-family HTH domain